MNVTPALLAPETFSLQEGYVKTPNNQKRIRSILKLDSDIVFTLTVSSLNVARATIRRANVVEQQQSWIRHFERYIISLTVMQHTYQ